VAAVHFNEALQKKTVLNGTWTGARSQAMKMPTEPSKIKNSCLALGHGSGGNHVRLVGF
jgi:hypothetical protein